MKKSLLLAFLTSLSFFIPLTASAHEVYVLTTGQVDQAIHTTRFSELGVIQDNLPQFLGWATLGIFIFILVWYISTRQSLAKFLAPFFNFIRPYASTISRITIGLSFLAAAYYQATFGPELPLSLTYGHLTWLITIILVITGLCIVCNIFTRIAAGIALLLYGISCYFHGWYMLTYVNYLGEMLVLLIASKRFDKIGNTLMRVLFGTALIYTSLYAKVLYNNLALATVEQYHLDKLFGLEPHFLVLGAAIVEIMIGLFFILGIEIRFTALFFEFWLIQSLLFFGEVVWPHIILIGIPIALIMRGYDNSYNLENLLIKKNYEPIL